MKFPGETKKPFKMGTVTTVNAETGEVIEEKKNAFTMLPCPPDVCQECAVDHPLDQPHNQQSIYYQMQFNAKHGRFPTWTDAMSHCSDEMKRQWRAHLVEMMEENGISIPADLREESKGVRS